MPPVEKLTLWFCDRGVFIGLRQEDNFHPCLVSHNADFFSSVSLSPSNYLRKCTFPCMKAIITMTPFSGSALSRSREWGGLCGVRLLDWQAHNNLRNSEQDEKDQGWTITMCELFWVMDTTDVSLQVLVGTCLLRARGKRMHAICFNKDWIKQQIKSFLCAACFPDRLKYITAIIINTTRKKRLLYASVVQKQERAVFTGLIVC